MTSFDHNVKNKVCLVVLCAYVATACRTELIASDPVDDPRALFATCREEVKNSRCIRRGPWLFAFGSAKPISSSASSHRAALAAARMDAIGNIVQACVLEQIGDGLRSLPEATRSVMAEMIGRNYSGAITMGSSQAIEECEDDNGAWCYMSAPAVGITTRALPHSVKECLANIAIAPEGKIKSSESDYFFEAAVACGLPDARSAWIRSQPVLLRPQLAAEAIPHAIRFWIDHRTDVMSLLSELKDPGDIKKAMIALPYCKELFDLLSFAFTAKGLPRVGNEIASLRPAVNCSALDKVNDADLFKELLSIGADKELGIKLIIAFDSQCPEKGEESKPSFHEAFAVYRNSDFKAAIPICLKAVSDAYNADTINLLGATARQLDLNRLGAVLCRQALFIDPKHPYASVNVALCYEKVGNRKLALEYAKRTIASETADSWAKSEAIRIANRSW